MNVFKISLIALTSLLIGSLGHAQTVFNGGEVLSVTTTSMGKLENGKMLISVATLTRKNKILQFAIVCEQGGFMSSSSADFILPSSEGSLTADTYKGLSLATFHQATSRSLPLTEKATVRICNHPNGDYILSVLQVDKYLQIDWIPQSSTEAQVDRPLGY